MASLWSNTKIKQKPLNNLCYGFSCKLKLDIDKSWLLAHRRSKKQSFTVDWMEKMIKEEIRKQSFWKYPRISAVPDNSTLTQLVDLHKLIDKHKVRIGGFYDGHVTFYGNTEADLRDVFDQVLLINPKWDQGEFCRVPDNVLEAVIEGKKIVKRIGLQWTHHVELVSGKFPRADKKAVLNYLKSMGDQVELGGNTLRDLAIESDYAYGLWFRTSDPSILDFVRLISPGSVKKVTMLEHRP